LDSRRQLEAAVQRQREEAAAISNWSKLVQGLVDVLADPRGFVSRTGGHRMSPAVAKLGDTLRATFHVLQSEEIEDEREQEDFQQLASLRREPRSAVSPTRRGSRQART
jgi:hypothetical protein